MKFNKVSLLQRIVAAGSVAVVTKLLKEGEGYEWASNKIRNRWQKCATARKAELK